MGDLAHALADTLAALGSRRCMCNPGQDVVAVIDALEGSMETTMFPTEVGAGFAADGYRRVDPRGTDLPVCVVTGKAGAAHLALPLENAFADGVGMVAVTGRCAVALATVSVANVELGADTVEGLPEVVDAFELACTPPQGPALVTLDRTAQYGPAEAAPRELTFGHRDPSPHDVERAADIITSAERPLILLGTGCLAGDVEGLREAVTAVGVPCVTSMPARGVVDEALGHCLGPAGMRGTAAANDALRRADAVLAAGCSFSHLTVPSGALDGTRVFRVDVRGQADAVADAAAFVTGTLRAVDEREPWVRADGPLVYEGPFAVPVAVSSIMDTLRPGDCHVYDLGAFSMWACAAGTVREPGSFLMPHNVYPLGYAIPGAIGALMRGTRERVVAVCGDGGFIASLATLPTAAERDLTIVVLDDGGMDIIRQRQDERGLSTLTSHLPRTDPVALARGCGIESVRVDRREDLAAQLEGAGRGPLLVHCRLERGPSVLGPLDGNNCELPLSE